MNPIKNPYSPGAGAPPPELAGRGELLTLASNSLQRIIGGKYSRSMMMLGLRGVGKTVLLNRIEQMADILECKTAIFEVDPAQTFPAQITKEIHRLLLKLDRRERIGTEVKRAFSILRSFASAFQVSMGELELSLSSERATGDLTLDLIDLFAAVGKAAKSRGTAVAMFIDEVQDIDKEGLSALIMALHKTSQLQLPLVIFSAGLPQLARLAGNAKTYAERLFVFYSIDKLDEYDAKSALVEPALLEGVEFSAEALDQILKDTDGYPYFLQLWGFHAWEKAKRSPISLSDARNASSEAQRELDNGFFRIRLEKLTNRQQMYVRAMAELGSGPSNSTEVADVLGISVKQAAPIRKEIIGKGITYSPARGLIAFTVPKFDEYVRRAVSELINK